jgi:hypothetical protein
MVKPALAIVRGNVAVDVNFPDVPVIVTLVVPSGAALVAVKVRTEFPEVGFGEMLALTPLGRPETARLTTPTKPYPSDMGMVLLMVVPWPRVTAPGLETVKLGALMDKENVVFEVCFPDTPVTVTCVVPRVATLLETRNKDVLPLAGLGEM